MLEDLRQYDNLGSAGYFWEVLNLFYGHPNAEWTKEGLDAHFRGKILDGKDVFDGGLPLLLKAGVVEVDITGIYHVTYSFRQRLHTQDHCRGRILEALLDAMKEDEDTYAIFSTDYCSFDFVNNVIQVEKSAFGLQFANIRDVLVSLGFLLPHPNYPERSFAVSKSHRNLFDRYLTHGIRKRRISPAQLRSLQEQQQENGLRGERFVYDYEGLRTSRENEIEWIASYDVAAGFDIMSFESNVSAVHDRFIEVKAYSGNNPYFYWSRNEMRVANDKGNKYFLYLVNLDEIEKAGYVPIIIQNPAIEVLNHDKWEKTVDKYLIARATV